VGFQGILKLSEVELNVIVKDLVCQVSLKLVIKVRDKMLQIFFFGSNFKTVFYYFPIFVSKNSM